MKYKHPNRLSNYPEFDLSALSTYKAKDPKLADLRKQRKAYRIKLELRGVEDKVISAELDRLFPLKP